MIAYGRNYSDPFAARMGPSEAIAEPLYVDIAALLAGGLPDAPVPSVLARTDGVCLFYRGQVNMLFGEPEAGKTWIALAALADALSNGETGLVIDLDHNGAAATVSRLLDFGVPRAIIVDSAHFRYAEPLDKDHLVGVVKDASTWPPTVAIVDSIGELLPMLGLGSNSPDDFTLAHAQVLNPLAITDAAVIAIDHLAKNPASKSQGATGTAAKRRAIGGASIRVELVESFVPGRGGRARLRVHKDRHGGLRRNCPVEGSAEPTVGIFTMTDNKGALTYTIKTDHTQSTAVADAVADIALLEALDPPPRSQRDVKERMSWGSDRSTQALKGYRDKHPDLVTDGQDDRQVHREDDETERAVGHQQATEARRGTDEGRAPRSGNAPEEQGAASLDDAPDSATPMSRSAEQGDSAVLDPLDVVMAAVVRAPDSAGPPDLDSGAGHADDERDDLGGASSLPHAESDKSGPPASTVTPYTTGRFGEYAPCGHPWAAVTTDTGRCAHCILSLPPDPRWGSELPAPDNGDRDARELALAQSPTTTGPSA